MADYDIGDTVRFSAEFTNSSEVAADPTTVTLKIRFPSGVIRTFTYAASEITKDSTGNYHYDLTITQAGEHYYKYYGTGTVVAAEEEYITVEGTVF